MRPVLRPSLCLVLALTAGTACTTPRGGDEPRRPVHVAVDAAPGGDGSAEHPLGSVEAALAVSGFTRVVLGPGRHPFAGTLPSDAALAGEGDAWLVGTVSVTGRLELDHLRVDGALRAGPGAVLRVASATIAGASEALVLDGARLDGDGIVLACAAGVCFTARGSTVAVSGLELRLGARADRGLRAETSSVTLTRVLARGGAISQLQIDSGTRLRLSGATLLDADGSALFLGSATTSTLTDVTIRGARRTGLLASGSRSLARRLKVGPLGPGAQGIAVQGAVLRFQELDLEGGLIVDDHRAAQARVTLVDATIASGDGAAIRLGSGRVHATGLRARGSGRGEDLVVASGSGARLELEGAELSDAGGFGVGLYNDAEGVIRARISRPRLGGVRIEASAGGELRVSGSEITDCRAGSGVEVLGALEVKIQDTEIARCPEAGVLVGERGTATLTRSRVSNAGRFGLAAFGGSELEVTASVVRGSKVAVFASCGDGASVTDAGDSSLSGAVTRCP